MSTAIGTADFHTAIQAAWDASNLNAEFKALWDPAVDANLYPVLHDQEATPKQPTPYCVVETDKPRIVTRMTGTDAAKREFRECHVTFDIHARSVAGDARSPKQIAADLMEKVVAVFGGHPTVSPTTLSMSNGGHIVTQYVNDYPVREEQYRYRWVLAYRFLLDVPVAA